MLKMISAAALAALVVGAAGAAQAADIVVDPYCMKDVAWVVDPASGPIQVTGCRPADQVPAADGQGWREYDDPDGGFIRARLISTTPAGAITFAVQYNGGGSGTFPYTVSGMPGSGGVLIASTVKVDALPAS